jgi:hypothetical protein
MNEAEEISPLRERQLRLLPASRPLLERFGGDFFRRLPRQPGVYLMRDERDRLVYVGKAKNLRQRLNSYRQAALPSRKTVRLVHLVRRIDWEVCPSDEAAQLRENELLRTHRPRFNRVGTWPRANCFIVLRSRNQDLRLSLTRAAPGELVHRLSEENQSFDAAPDREDSGQSLLCDPEDRWFGAFKPGASFAFGALLRLLWQALHRLGERNALPRRLVLDKPPARFDFEHQGAAAWSESLSAFLSGMSAEIIEILRKHAPVFPTGFEQQAQQADLELLHQFFLLGPQRNREMILRTRRSEGLILQEELDDLRIRVRNVEDLQ